MQLFKYYGSEKKGHCQKQMCFNSKHKSEIDEIIT